MSKHYRVSVILLYREKGEFTLYPMYFSLEETLRNWGLGIESSIVCGKREFYCTGVVDIGESSVSDAHDGISEAISKRIIFAGNSGMLKKFQLTTKWKRLDDIDEVVVSSLK